MTADTTEELSLELSDGAMRTVIGRGVVDEVRAIVAELRGEGVVVVISDGVAKRLRGESVEARVERQLDGLDVRRLTARSDGHGVVLDEETVEHAVAGAAGAGVIVSVGSGTVTDLAKVVSQRIGAPLVAVQTAASVNGFSDPLSVLVRSGAKRTMPSTWPAALVIDLDVLADAPDALTRSGVGDAVAIWSAPADWYLACALRIDPGPYDDGWIDPVKRAAAPLADRGLDPGARLGALVRTLTVGGLVIGGAGTTAPLSGCEHLVSHVLDMAAMAEGGAHDLHGSQVGVASILAASLWDVALEEEAVFELPAERFAAPADLRDRVLRTWAAVDATGTLGEECWTAVERKVAIWERNRDEIAGFFGAARLHAERLRSLVSAPEAPAAALRAWGAPTRFSQLTPAVDERRARWALEALPFMRDRLTLADLLLFAGRWNGGLFDRVFARAEAVGGGL